MIGHNTDIAATVPVNSDELGLGTLLTFNRLLTSTELAQVLGLPKNTLENDRVNQSKQSNRAIGIPFLKLGRRVRYCPVAVYNALRQRIQYPTGSDTDNPTQS